MPQRTELEALDFLLSQVCRLHYVRAQGLLDAIGIYRGQPPVLYVLHEQEGLTQSELAARLEVAPATVTKMLQRLERAGFVQRQTDAADQRVWAGLPRRHSVASPSRSASSCAG
jgi:DNA-binding MarR family transcriptional regulator